MDEATRRELELIQSEDAEFLKGMEDLPTDDDESDEEMEMEMTSEDEEDEVARNTRLNASIPPIAEENENESASSDSGAEMEEDIYGRIKLPSQTASKSKYVPPHLRNKPTTDDEKYQQLVRLMNGKLNRLSEANLESILRDIEEIYRTNIRSHVNKVLCECIEQLCCSKVQVMLPFITVCSALLTGLFHSIGVEIGGYAVETYVKRLETVLTDVRSRPDAVNEATESKESINLLLLVGFMYNFGIISCDLIYDLFRSLVKSFTEMEIEMLLALLKQCGRQLRSDDQSSLRDMIAMIQERSQSATASTRIQFMLDVISELNGTKKRRVESSTDMKMQSLRKWIGRVKTRTDSSSNPLRLSLKDLLNADEAGRWWIVGGTWIGYQKPNSTQEKPEQSKLMQLASQQRMNTDVRKRVFCAIMGAEDVENGYEKLLHLGLKDKQEREIVRVLIDCCGQEKIYNAYYLHLGVKFCDMHNRFKRTFQVSYWDIFKQLDKLNPRRVYNLACLLSDLISRKLLTFSCFKVIDFTDLNTQLVMFLQVVFERLLKQTAEEDAYGPFQRISQLKDYALLRDGLAVFIHQHFTRSTKSIQDDSVRDLVRKRTRVVKRLLDQLN